MLRKTVISMFVILLLAGCGQRAPSYTSYGGYPMELRADLREPNAQVFSYSHFLALTMRRDSVKPRFERARDKCLHDATLNCKLISASLSVNGYAGSNNAEANLQVALPHDQIAAFEQKLLEPLPQDTSENVIVRSRSTIAENVSDQAADTDRKIAQLTNLRDNLAALAKRPNLSIEDLIKVETELSKAQGDLDEALAQKRDVGEHVAKERLDIALSEKVDLMSPIALVWRNAVGSLVESTASAIDFLIRVVPWLPIVAAGVFLVSLFWRLFRRKKPAA
jgi:hypothetical protein